MYIENSISYADDPTPILEVEQMELVCGHRFYVKFSNGEEKLIYLGELLTTEAFAPLKDINIERNVTIDHGIPTWNNGTIDISPDYLYKNGTLLKRWNFNDYLLQGEVLK